MTSINWCAWCDAVGHTEETCPVKHERDDELDDFLSDRADDRRTRRQEEGRW